MPTALANAMTQYIDAQGGGEGVFATPIDGLVLMRRTDGSLPSHAIYRPCLCVVAQGAKQVTFGTQALDYDELQCLIVSMDLPVTGRVTRGSAARPYLAIALEFDVLTMRDVMEDLESPPRPAAGVGPAMFVNTMVPPLTDCTLRLIRMLETPSATPVLYPALMREICFRLLTGANGGRSVSWRFLTVTRGVSRMRFGSCAIISRVRSGWRSWLRRLA